jgi:prepilin-type processing-associated H-X9-DG protein
VSPGSCAFAERPSKSDVSYSYYGWVIDRSDDGDPVALEWWSDVHDVSAQYLGVIGCAVAFGLWDMDVDDYDPDCEIGQDVPDWMEGWIPDGAGNAGSSTLYRFKEGIERFMITDINNPAGSAMAQSGLPVMWDSLGGFILVNHTNWFNHVPGGCNVLYMDGHVEFVKYPGKFPLSKNGQVAVMST